MQSLGNALPNPNFLSHVGKDTAEEATWVCETCGVVQPRQLRVNGRWIRQKCTCQIAHEKAQEAQEWRLKELLGLINVTYAWLGVRWSDKPLVEKTFETFEVDRQQNAFIACRDFAIDLSGTLILHGTYGTGKTHLLAAICNELRLHMVASRFTTSPKLFKAIQERIQYNEDYNGIIHNAITTPLLVIDDIDKAKVSEFREEIYFEIVDERTKHGLPIAISTNRLTDLANYVGGAVCSRLSIGQIAVQMIGDDYRMEM